MPKQPEFSETGFAFNFTRELVEIWGTHIVRAPEFPTQRREGKSGGGWDVRLDSSHGFAYFAQFKTAEYCVGEKVKHVDFGLPAYRFKLRTAKEPNQHELLRVLETQGNLVEYVAPCFHTGADFERLFATRGFHKAVRRLRPTRMGRIVTGETHFVLYEEDGSRPTLYSEPRFIEDADYGQIVPDGFAGWPAEAQLGDNDAMFDRQTEHDPQSLAHRLEVAAQTIAEAYGMTSVLSDLGTSDPHLRARTMMRSLVGGDVIVVSDPR